VSRSVFRILLVEDDRDLASGLADALDLSGYPSEVAGDGKTGLEKALSGKHDLVILDAMLPGLSGFDMLKELRRKERDLPVLMLTAKGLETDKVRGLRLGADDYVTKPFGMMELVARVEALLRRAGSRGRAPDRLEAFDVVVDFRLRKAWRDRRPVALTPREYQILELLSSRRGEAVPRDDLLAALWGTSDGVEVSSRTVDQHVAALRRKLGDDADSPRLIETVYGFGYRLARG
jgi:two-component system response regulator RegX3